MLLTSVAALGGLLFGYDTAVISGAIGFLEKHFDLDPQMWKGWAAACALLGCAMGAALAGMLSDRFGRKGMLMVSAVLFLVSAVGTAFPRTFTEFIIFRIIGGLGIGAASMTSPMYIAEIAPARIRGRMVSVNQFAIVSGILVVYFVNYFIAEYGAGVDRAGGVADGSWNAMYGWRWMFGSGILPSALFLLAVVPGAREPALADETGPPERGPGRAYPAWAAPSTPATELAEIQDALAHETGSLANFSSRACASCC